ncbi:hypothetical protein ACJMK2_015312 [Sinanodonta woodiana]|uniref:Lupus La protein n=1 Tax=Sinanodonta woodiana TaxID=1069815 RepID=A0ABD3V391_SINWO
MAANGTGDALSDLEKKIIRQVEYYFGDINLPRDKFLLEQIKENEDGWVTMETMVKFNRLRELSEDFEVIAGSLRKSTSGLVEVSEDNQKVRRNPKQPMPENTAERRQELMDRTLYVKPFPLDVTLDKLMEFFEGHGNVEGLLMRRDMKKKFKGSVFITFKKNEDTEKFVKAETVKFEDTELIKKLKKDYYAEKDEQKKQRKMEHQKKKQEVDKKKEQDAKEKIKSQLIEGAVLHLKGLKKETQRDDIKNFFQDHGNVAWVNFNRGDEEAKVRFSEKNAAKEILEKVKNADGKIVLNDAELECRVLEGDEEFEYWENAFREMAERRDSNKRKGSNRGRQGRFGGRKGYMGKKNRSRKERQSDDEEDGNDDDGNNVEDEDADEPPAKQIKVE